MAAKRAPVHIPTSLIPPAKIARASNIRSIKSPPRFKIPDTSFTNSLNRFSLSEHPAAGARVSPRDVLWIQERTSVKKK